MTFIDDAEWAATARAVLNQVSQNDRATQVLCMLNDMGEALCGRLEEHDTVLTLMTATMKAMATLIKAQGADIAKLKALLAVEDKG